MSVHQTADQELGTVTHEARLAEAFATLEQTVASQNPARQERATKSVELPTKPKIMMIDDDELNSLVVGEYLRSGGYEQFVHTQDPLHALSLALRELPAAILLDLHMPQLSGFVVLEQIRADESLAQTPIVILTSSTDEQEKLRALEMGATDFLQKPLHGGELLARLRNILLAKAYQDQWRKLSNDLEAAVRQRTAELEASRLEVIHCLARAAEFRDDDTGHHVVRVGRYARIIGEELGMDRQQLDVLEHAAKLHDIGKIGVPDAILLKPGKLTPEEFEAMQKHANYGKRIIEGLHSHEDPQLRQHTELGAKILSAGSSPILALAAKIALTHHEHWDGTGYPLGLAGHDIPIEGRITAVADVFDALSTKRPYKPAYPLERCFAIMLDARGTHFDPAVLDAFLARRDDIVNVQILNADLG